MRPDYSVAVRYVTLNGTTLAAVLRRAADWVESPDRPFDHSDVGPIQVTYSEDDEIFRLSFVAS